MILGNSASRMRTLASRRLRFSLTVATVDSSCWNPCHSVPSPAGRCHTQPRLVSNQHSCVSYCICHCVCVCACACMSNRLTWRSPCVQETSVSLGSPHTLTATVPCKVEYRDQPDERRPTLFPLNTSIMHFLYLYIETETLNKVNTWQLPYRVVTKLCSSDISLETVTNESQANIPTYLSEQNFYKSKVHKI